MLVMEEVSAIRHLVRRQGLSIRAAAKQLGISRKAVRRYLRDDVAAGVRRSVARRKPQQEAIAKRVGEILDEAPKWTAGKQRLTGTRLHKLLAQEGIVVGLTTLYALLSERNRRRQEVFIPLVYPPGDLAEVDFFEVYVDVLGMRQKAWMFLMRLMHSGRDFAWLYERQDQVSFLDGHVRAFEHFGGVPARIALDNLRAAVARMLAGSERVLTARYAALSSHYTFEPCFARPRTGHDKGGVEARGRSIRTEHLVPIPAGDDLEAMSRTLLKALDDGMSGCRSGESATIADLFSIERAHLLPLPTHAFDPASFSLTTVGPKSLVNHAGAYYSVWNEWVGSAVKLFARPSEIEIVGQSGSVHHPRLRFGGKSIDYRHYVRELARKPQAIRQVSEPLIRDLGEPFATLWRRLVAADGAKRASRVFAKVLDAIVELGFVETQGRLARALETGEPVTLALRPAPAATPACTLPTNLRAIEIPTACAADFDVLLGVGS
jgi:transposase